MSDAAAAQSAAAPAKTTKKRTGGAAKAKKPADHPKYSDMIKAALTALKVCNFVVSLFRCLARNAMLTVVSVKYHRISLLGLQSVH